VLSTCLGTSTSVLWTVVALEIIWSLTSLDNSPLSIMQKNNLLYSHSLHVVIIKGSSSLYMDSHSGNTMDGVSLQQLSASDCSSLSSLSSISSRGSGNIEPMLVLSCSEFCYIHYANLKILSQILSPCNNIIIHHYKSIIRGALGSRHTHPERLQASICLKCNQITNKLLGTCFFANHHTTK